MKRSSILKSALGSWFLAVRSAAVVSADEGAAGDGAPVMNVTDEDLSTQPSPTQATCTTLLQWTPSPSDRPVVVQVLSMGYMDVEHNFIYHMELNSLFTRDHLYIVCLDQESKTFLESTIGIRCALLHYGSGVDRRSIWTLRMHVASCLILSGRDVLLSDADAIWLKDPMKDIDRLGPDDSNIVASRGRLPSRLYKVWGATVCFGFILFRSGGAAMSSFLATATEAVNVLHDDQIAVNMALKSLGISWDEDSDMRLEDSTGRGRGGTGGDVPLVVTLLPHDTFTRSCGNSTDFVGRTVVAHCLSHRKGAKMSDWMEAAGLWNVSGANVDP